MVICVEGSRRRTEVGTDFGELSRAVADPTLQRCSLENYKSYSSSSSYSLSKKLKYSTILRCYIKYNYEHENDDEYEYESGLSRTRTRF